MVFLDVNDIRTNTKVTDPFRSENEAVIKTYEVIFDTFGKTPVSQSRRVFKKDSAYLIATFGLPRPTAMSRLVEKWEAQT